MTNRARPTWPDGAADSRNPSGPSQGTNGKQPVHPTGHTDLQRSYPLLPTAAASPDPVPRQHPKPREFRPGSSGRLAPSGSGEPVGVVPRTKPARPPQQPPVRPVVKQAPPTTPRPAVNPSTPGRPAATAAEARYWFGDRVPPPGRPVAPPATPTYGQTGKARRRAGRRRRPSATGERGQAGSARARPPRSGKRRGAGQFGAEDAAVATEPDGEGVDRGRRPARRGCGCPGWTRGR